VQVVGCFDFVSVHLLHRYISPGYETVELRLKCDVTRAEKPDFVFRRNGRVHLNRAGASVQSNTGSRGVRISGSNAGYTMFRGSVKSTGLATHSIRQFPLHFPSRASPCAITFQLESTISHTFPSQTLKRYYRVLLTDTYASSYVYYIIH